MRTPRHPVRTDAELFDLWTRLMGRLGFASRQLWFAPIEDGVTRGQLVQVAELPPQATETELAGLREMLGVLGPEVAILLARPGYHGTDEDDRQWARDLVETAREAHVHCRLMHLATDGRIVPLPLDELLPTGRA